MTYTLRQRLLALTLLVAIAFGLRLIRLDAVPLRGDEAFTIRYMADTPTLAIPDLAGQEIHPLGAFVGYWAWKSAAGDSAFAMRYLSVLGNLIGVAVMAALARRLFRDDRLGYLAAALWATNAFLIWHAQDVRNYAPWSGFSVLAMWLFLRAADRNRPRDWALYVAAEALALYTFYLEAFLVAVQIVYLLLVRRSRPVLARGLRAGAVLAVLLIPWLVQAWVLAGSGYRGATDPAAPARLITWILPELLTGDTVGSPWDTLLPLAWIVAAAATLLASRSVRAALAAWLAVWIMVPAVLQLIAATRMDVFNPRYVIAITPALLLFVARALIPAPGLRRAVHLLALPLLAVPLLGFGTLVDYYRGEDPKAPDWPALAAYLDARARPGDLVLQTGIDPALRYYYHGDADEKSLLPGVDVAVQLRADMNFYPTIWFIGRSPDVETVLNDHMQPVSFHTLRGFSVMQFRQWQPKPSEIAVQTDVVFGDIARLRGFTLQGPDRATRAMTVLLYWEPLAQTSVDYKVFVHLLGPPRPDSSPLWGQDDHRPLYGFASTLAWEPGALIRDPYHLLDDPALTLVPAEYTVEIGLYDPDTNERLPVRDSGGQPLGDGYVLQTLRLPLP